MKIQVDHFSGSSFGRGTDQETSFLLRGRLDCDQEYRGTVHSEVEVDHGHVVFPDGGVGSGSGRTCGWGYHRSPQGVGFLGVRRFLDLDPCRGLGNGKQQKLMCVVFFFSFFFRFPTGIRSRGLRSLRTPSDPLSKRCVHPLLFCVVRDGTFPLSEKQEMDGSVPQFRYSLPFPTIRGVVFGGLRWNAHDRRLGPPPPTSPF